MTERELDEFHAGHVGVELGEVFLQRVEDGLLCTEEDHPVTAARHDVEEYLAPAVLAVFLAVYHADVEWDIRAVADGEHSAVDHLEILGEAVGDVHDDPVGNADVVRTLPWQPLGYGLVHSPAVELVVYVEIGLHP